MKLKVTLRIKRQYPKYLSPLPRIWNIHSPFRVTINIGHLDEDKQL